MPYPWAVGEVLHATDLNSAIASAAAGAGPGLPVAGVAGYLFGLTLGTDAVTPNTVLDIAAGSCADSTGTVMITLGAFTKSISGAWVAGSGQPGMGAGLTATASTWYHVFACVNAGVSDVFFDNAANGSHAPLGTTSFRRIGSFRLDASTRIYPFDQVGDRFVLRTPVTQYGAIPGVTTGVTIPLAFTPLGIVTMAQLTGNVSDGVTANSVLYLSSLTQADIAAGGGVAITATAGGTTAGTTSYFAQVLTNTASQIRLRTDSTTLSARVNIQGWIDTRGR